ncbi:spermidine synthase [Paenibacillus bovis]|uniref:Spermidine synthase n=1 Tax=Paenibacillus bovis TaxID=1616788 RepID=A0A172ZHE8_9BACL|nr:fused MFS/spermidine synthase [Paenibacillus bovis]ANF96707.1 spermidine synthase [Paenibacillus bovis]
MQVLFHKATSYADITIYETDRLYGEKGHFRVLQFANADIQGALDLNNPQRIVFEYPRAIIHLLEHHLGDPQHIFMIGQGIGTLSRYFADQQIQVAELNPTVAELSIEYFGCASDPLWIGDGRQLLEKQPNDQYDSVIVDAFDESGTPDQLVSLEFFTEVQHKLHEKGALIMNLIGRGTHDTRIHAIYTTMCEVFSHVRCFQLPVEKNSDVRNIIMMGSQASIRYQSRYLAGFTEEQPEYAYVIRDGM